jgi:hypothetical protein
MKPIKAIVSKIEKPRTPKPPPPVLKISGIRAKIDGPDYAEVMRWRRGQITTKDGSKIMGYRKIFLGSPEYRVKGKEFPSDQVYAFRRDEYICNDNQAYDPQAYLP